MNCKEIRTIIDQLIDRGQADGEALAREHMKTCGDCAGYYEFWSSRRSLAPARAPEGMTDKIMARVLAADMKPARRFVANPLLRYAAPAALLASLLVFAGVRGYMLHNTVPVTFKLSCENARTIALAGDFNGWKSDRIYLEKKGDEWTATVRLKPRRYQYMFVIDGEKFVPDPGAQMYADDGFGQKNSVIDISASA